jgi:hypothetical protein
VNLDDRRLSAAFARVLVERDQPPLGRLDEFAQLRGPFALVLGVARLETVSRDEDVGPDMRLLCSLRPRRYLPARHPSGPTSGCGINRPLWADDQ